MIPFFEIDTIAVGQLTIQVWGLLVALGILAGARAAVWLAKARSLEEKAMWDLATWVIVGAFVGARLFHVLYEPTIYAANPVEILMIWHGGLSIMGGFIGAVVVGVWYLRRRRLDLWAYTDVAVFGLPLGIFIGRIGCFLTHLHPGKPTDFFLGVQYPDAVRHDLGLYDSFNGLALFLVFLWLVRRKPSVGTFTIIFLLWYGVTRFFSDFLRATDGAIVDTRYFGLTPAQYTALVMVGIGIYLFSVSLRGTGSAGDEAIS